jgi:hypothetical protein
MYCFYSQDRVILLSSKWKKYILPICQQICIRLHGVISQRIEILMVTVVRTCPQDDILPLQAWSTVTYEELTWFYYKMDQTCSTCENLDWDYPGGAYKGVIWMGIRERVYVCVGEVFIYLAVLLERPPLWSSGQSSWLQDGDVLCFLWGTNWIYICYVEESRPPLWI